MILNENLCLIALCEQCIMYIVVIYLTRKVWKKITRMIWNELAYYQAESLTGGAVITQACDNRHKMLSRWF